MMRPEGKNKECLDRLTSEGGSLWLGFIEYLKEDRDAERAAMEDCPSDKTEAYKGRCQKATDLITTLESLAGGSGKN